VLMRLGTAGVAGGGPTHFNEPSDVVTAPNGDIYVADGHSGQNPKVPPDYVTRIVKFSRDGKFIKEWGKLGTGPGEFRNAHALALDSRGRVFVADRGNSRLQIFDSAGKFIAEWKQFGRPSGLYIDKNDKLYAIDADSSPATNPGWKKGIRIGSAKDGSVKYFIEDMESTTIEHSGAEGVGVDAEGNVYGAVVRRQMLEKHIRK